MSSQLLPERAGMGTVRSDEQESNVVVLTRKGHGEPADREKRRRKKEPERPFTREGCHQNSCRARVFTRRRSGRGSNALLSRNKKHGLVTLGGIRKEDLSGRDV